MNFSPLFPPFLRPLPPLSFVDLRPKGRGRPQRILLGVWPDEHIRGVIRAVVFRDGHSPHIVKEEPTTMYPTLANYAACNGPEGAVSPGAAAAAAVAAVAQGNAAAPISHFFSLFLSPRPAIDALHTGRSAELKSVFLVFVMSPEKSAKSFYFRFQLYVIVKNI